MNEGIPTTEGEVPGRKWFAAYDEADGHDAASHLLGERRERLARCVERARAEPVGKRIRKLRVATRRLDTAARFVAPLADAPAVKRVRRELRRLRRSGGEVRRGDVFIARLQETASVAEGADGHDVAHASIALIGRLGAQRAAALRRFVEVVASDRSSTTLDALTLRRDEHVTSETLAMTLLREAGAAFTAIASVPTLDFEALHDLRLRAKRLRYAAEATAPVVGESEAAALIHAVTPLQDELGSINDLAELAGELASFHADVADLPGGDALRLGVDRLLLAASSERDRRAVAFGRHRRDRVGEIASVLASLSPKPGLRLTEDPLRSESA